MYKIKKKKNKNLIQTIISPSLGYTDNFPKREMWKEIVKQFNGEFKVIYNSSHELERHKILIPFKNWKILITVSDIHPLKFSASFNANRDLNFIISWEGFVERLMKKLGKKEIEIGWTEFDKYYLIEGNNEEYIKEILTTDIQKTILENNLYSISYQTDWKLKKSELLSVIQRQAGEKELIIELIKMHEVIINNLLNIQVIK